MSNMSHCRFQNTNMDLQDCIDYAQATDIRFFTATDQTTTTGSIRMLIDTNGKDEDGYNLSRDEKDAMLDMIGKAQYFAEIGESLADILYNQED